MTASSLLTELGRVDEPQNAQEYADVLSRVATAGQPIIVQRNGADLAAVIPLECLDLVRETLAQREVEKLAGRIDWDTARKTLQPPQQWFEGEEPKPF